MDVRKLVKIKDSRPFSKTGENGKKGTDLVQRLVDLLYDITDKIALYTDEIDSGVIELEDLKKLGGKVKIPEKLEDKLSSMEWQVERVVQAFRKSLDKFYNTWNRF